MMFLVPADSITTDDILNNKLKSVKIKIEEEVLSDSCVDTEESEEVTELKEKKENNNISFDWILKTVLSLLIVGSLSFFGYHFKKISDSMETVTSNETTIGIIEGNIDSINTDYSTLYRELTDLRVDVAEMSGKLDLILNAIENQ